MLIHKRLIGTYMLGFTNDNMTCGVGVSASAQHTVAPWTQLFENHDASRMQEIEQNHTSVS